MGGEITGILWFSIEGFQTPLLALSAFLVVGAVAGLAVLSASRKRIAAALDLSHRDELTRLPNRRYFTVCLWDRLKRYKGRSPYPALMLLDLDRFKVVNDSLGHQAGDELLIAVARLLSAALREGDVLARLGGDEFAVLALVENREEAEALASRLLESLDRPVNVHGHELWPQTSVGIAIPGPIRPPANELMSMADVALYQAKALGKGIYFVHDPHTALPSAGRLSLEAQLRQALAHDELSVHFQPLYDLRQERFVSLEVLIRWNNPKYGILLPDEFLPLAEEMGLSLSFGDWVLDRACRQAMVWSSLFGNTVELSVNLSAVQLRELDFLPRLSAAMRVAGIGPDSITCEITESMLVNNEGQTKQNLQRLRQLGFKIAIDDFGVGYSSLSYLREMEADILKIDKSFMTELDKVKNQELVRSIVKMAHGIGMVVVAEGIETNEQLAFVREIGCDMAQGFVIQPPLPEKEITSLLMDGAAMPPQPQEAWIAA